MASDEVGSEFFTVLDSELAWEWWVQHVNRRDIFGSLGA